MSHISRSKGKPHMSKLLIYEKLRIVVLVSLV